MNNKLNYLDIFECIEKQRRLKRYKYIAEQKRELEIAKLIYSNPIKYIHLIKAIPYEKYTLADERINKK